MQIQIQIHPNTNKIKCEIFILNTRPTVDSSNNYYTYIRGIKAATAKCVISLNAPETSKLLTAVTSQCSSVSFTLEIA